MTKITFNKSNIESIETPLKRSLVYSDEIKGLHLETFKSGTKTFRLALITQGINPQIQKVKQIFMEIIKVSL